MSPKTSSPSELTIATSAPSEPGHDGLVRALAAEAELEVVALDRLARLRHAARVGDEVDHRAPDDSDARLVTHGDNGA